MTLAFDSQDENGLQFEKIGPTFKLKPAWSRNRQEAMMLCFPSGKIIWFLSFTVPSVEKVAENTQF